MGKLFTFIYKFFIGQILNIVNFVLSWNNEKIQIREDKWQDLLKNLPEKNGQKRVLIHAASLGEFEQVKFLTKILIEENYQVITSFYSPSGFENTEIGEYTDYKVYMPVDSLSKSRLYANTIKPDFTFFVRYDLWYNHIYSLRKAGSRVYLINATYTSNNFLGKSFIGKTIYKEVIKLLEGIFAVDEANASKFKNITSADKVNVLADTRYDRILNKVVDSKNNSNYKTKFDYTTIILGSTWKQDEDVIFSSLQKLLEVQKINLIIAPHEPNKNNIDRIQDHFPTSEKLSELENYEIPQITLVDSIGKLLELYSLADIAYIGGAFGKGVHSVTEAAGYGLPIFCGSKNYENSYDAINLKNQGGVFAISNSQEFYKLLKNIIDDDNLKKEIGIKNYEYVKERSGSSEILISKIF